MSHKIQKVLLLFLCLGIWESLYAGPIKSQGFSSSPDKTIGSNSSEIKALHVKTLDTKTQDFKATPASLKELTLRYAKEHPKIFAENPSGSINHIPTTKPIVFLTLDACSGKVDERILKLLESQHIPAMLFLNARWIDKHIPLFKSLSKNPLFSLQNHGTLHKPLSVDGKSIYHIQGTKNIKEVYEEVMQNHKKMIILGAKPPRFFRSGTAYYDDVALKILKDLGYQAMGFDVLGDAGATFNTEQIIKQSALVKNGSILIYHFNHPEKDSYEGLSKVIEILKKKGFVFGRLEDFLTKPQH
ncbi:polysaccharide deacetylase family protein [Helicobacter mustelae]|uniref:Putative polysaccharide deacetylase n=1 Tax=Helicobacter mustelae (strain ATCC 43772 / CCUG 25715 / CIP 103759 / LMG 18044 / NCTC 12198 / R85-136P) TaxID=679897 RepID=D3UH45_HELM1|nr:polysaccharide deacetylase family protein [Helicobacter mustelae]CBG39817.1 Putative polysaccharide deacetylase [Helicobacter mustelae 12198]SQH71326.1 polysaccharide deacetylase [Helicobacter mustelae]